MNTTYHNDPDLKAQLVASAEAHAEADRFARGSYFDVVGSQWRGCAVGCNVAPLLAAEQGVPVLKVEQPLDWHKAQERLTGIPEWLGRVQDALFECLPVERKNVWPVEFLSAVPVGSSLDGVREAWLRDVVMDPERGAVANAARALESAGFADRAAALRGLPCDEEWSVIRDTCRAAAADAAAYAADAAADAAAYAADAYAYAAYTYAAYTYAAAAYARADAYDWMADRLIHHLTTERAA